MDICGSPYFKMHFQILMFPLHQSNDRPWVVEQKAILFINMGPPNIEGMCPVIHMFRLSWPANLCA